ncbi:MAG: tRNA-specific 2-thiouridylase [Planctomycetes bacterium]|nr:tRNA-specific 2-thiouridylase [Planctomycetota bacterium]
MSKRVVVAMSGGVDSSVAAYLLKKQGYDVTGLFMSLGACLERLAPRRKACCSVFDAQDAQRVADHLDIKFSILNFKHEFEQVIDYFCSEYDKGRTPNPCIRCNQYLKFGKLMEYADKLGADYIATGHYARITSPSRHLAKQASPQSNNPLAPFNKGELYGKVPLNKGGLRGLYHLNKGIDSTKDQSYVLFTLTQPQLARIIFPLGELTKQEVRKIAHQIDLPVKDKPESQDICFVPSSGYQDLLKERIPDRLKPGKVKNAGNKVIGQHDGFQLFTIGQRRGLRIALGHPAYVSKIIPKTNTVILGDRADVLNTTFVADEVNWTQPLSTESKNAKFNRKTLDISGHKNIIKRNKGWVDSDVKIRYLHKQSKAKIKILSNKRVEVRFKQPQFAITPGQAAVFYKGDTVLGGAWIKKVIK